MGIDSKRRSAVESDSPSSQTLGFAVESEIIPTLLQVLARETSASAAMATNGTQDKASGNSPGKGAAPLTWVESQSSSRAAMRSAVPQSPRANRRDSTTATSERLLDKAAALQSTHWVSAEKFAVMVLDDNEDLAAQLFLKLRDEGIPDETLLLELLAPTSVELGKRWEQDLTDFADVTVGVCRLHRLLRSLHPQQNRRLDNCAHGGRVALVPAPGEQHSFGLLLVGELLFRAGWYTDIDIDAESHQLSKNVSKNWYEMVGISVSCESRLQGADELIRSVKRNSCNPDVAILVGGRAFAENPGLGHELGADQVVTEGADIAAIAAQFAPTERRI